MAYVLRVVSRLQGDSLSESRSEEERRLHVAEQAVPDISCMLHNAATVLQSDVCVCTLHTDAPSSLLRSSVAWGGHVARTIAGIRGLISGVVLCEYPQQTSKIILQPSITRLILLLSCWLAFLKKTTPSIF